MPARDTSPNGRDRVREKDRDRYRDKPRSRDRDTDRARDRDRERDRDRDRGGRPRDAERDRERDRKRERAAERDKRDRHRDPHETGGRDRPARDRSRPAETDPDSRRRPERAGDERARSHGARERDDGRRRDAPREREKDRGREGDREKDRGREGDREKREREGPEEEARERRGEKAGRDGDRGTGARGEGSRRDRDTGVKEKPEKVDKKPMTEEEIQVMQRRRRAEAWQKKKRAMEEDAARADEEAAAGRKVWTLDDDGSDDDDDAAPARAGHQPKGAMDVDGDDELDRFMEGVGTRVQEDLLAIDPAVARDAQEVNPQLARAGIHVSIPEPTAPPDTGAAAAADVDMADAGGAAAGRASPSAAADGAAAEAAGSAAGGGDVGGAGAVSSAAAAAGGEMADVRATSAAAAVDEGAAPAAAAGTRHGDRGAMAAAEAAASSAAAASKSKVSATLARRPVMQLQLKKPIAQLPAAAAKPGSKAYDVKRTKRRGKAQERRKKAIERAAPKALNPYASDSDDDAAAAPEAASSDDEAAAAEEVEEELDDEAWAKAVQSGNLSKGERLVPVDHATVDYPPFRKVFYIESPDLARMTAEDVTASYIDMGGVKVRGKDVPKPVRSWAQCGLPLPILGTLKRHLYREPLPIQALALPIIMSGRDCIGVATTGSGKTLGFVLPMLRHVMDQVVRGLDESLGNGPIGLIIAPTRELVQQISKEVRLFAKVMDLAVVAAYGGSGVKEQINGLKRGAHVVACTPGRMIDILVTSNGSITNLRRVTMLVIDEADRMFDMGFEPQISRILGQIRPNRQTVLFSATFPRQVEILARAILTDPIEVQVGGRSTVSSTIKQIVEIRADDDERFARILEILGEYVESTKILVFVNSQEKASTLFQQLLTYGYPNLMLHGDMQQTDRESVISDFKTGVCSVLVATSVAARGLDVRDLGVVVNYDTPNHLEEYVHRCGRTGRAGAEGTAITFLSPQDDQYAPDLVKAFRDSKLAVPADLQKLADGFKVKRKKGIAKLHGSGFGGSGFKFDQNEDDMHTAIKKRHAIEYRQPGDEAAAAKPDAAAAAAHQSAMQRFDDGVGGDGGRITAKYATTVEAPPEVLNISEARMKQAQKIALQAASRVMSASRITENVGSGIRRVVPSGAASANAADTQAALVLAAQSAASKIAGRQGMQLTRGDAIKAAVAAQSAAAKQVATAQPYFEADLVINDFPQAARYHVTHRDTIAHIAERTGAAIIIRGQYYAPGQTVPPDDCKLYLLIEGPTMQVVKRAKELIKQIIEERTERSMRRDTGAMGRTSVV